MSGILGDMGAYPNPHGNEPGGRLLAELEARP